MTTARFFRYRPVEPHVASDVLARFDDSNAALTERRVGRGIVLLWASTLDSFWNDLALKPVYLPFVHRLMQYLASYTAPTPWHVAGQVLNLAEERGVLANSGLDGTELVVVTPTGRRVPVSQGERLGFLTLEEQGRYEIRNAMTINERPLTLAVNVDLSESDLTAVDPDELAGAVTGRARGDRDLPNALARSVSPDDLEERQGFWWYLLVAALLLFVSETIVSNRLSRQTLDLA